MADIFKYDPEYAKRMLVRDFPDLLDEKQAEAMAYLTALLIEVNQRPKNIHYEKFQ